MSKTETLSVRNDLKQTPSFQSFVSREAVLRVVELLLIQGVSIAVCLPPLSEVLGSNGDHVPSLFFQKTSSR